MSIPSHPDRFTTVWLERVLGAPAGSLIGFSAKSVGTGQMSLSFRVTLNWQNNEGPASLIAKCPSLDAGTRAIAAALRAYALELGWYRDFLAPIWGAFFWWDAVLPRGYEVQIIGYRR